MNPTGSFKDRGMTVAVTRAVESGAQILVCASTGNTAASVAAYAARAGLKSAVVLPSGKVAAGKLSQAAAHGARLVEANGTFDRALALTRAALQKLKGLYLLNSLNPYRIEGQKTVSFEVLEQLRFEVPDFVVLPVGNAGNISAVWKGFRELHSWGILKRVPKLIGVQAAGAAPIADAFERHLGVVKPLAEPKTVATAISIGNPISWKKAMNAIKESGGLAVSVSDKEIVRARNDLATKEGIFVEYASATPIAAIRKLRGQVREDDLVVVIATGHGLKDQETVGLETKTIRNAADENSLVKLLSE
jgi:threonine synthase